MVTKATKKKSRVKVGKLQLKKETIKELGKSAAKKVRGGMNRPLDVYTVKCSAICGE